MSKYTIEPATSADNEGLCALCDIPLPGNIAIALERRPNFFAGSKIQCEEVETYICKSVIDREVVGVFSIGTRRVFHQKNIEKIRYLSDLRISPAARGNRLLHQIAKFVSKILGDGFGQTIVFADNSAMLRLIERMQKRNKKMQIIRYSPFGDFVSYMVKPSGLKKHPNLCTVRIASEKDIAQMQSFLLAEGPKKEFYPFYDFNSLHTDYYAGLTISDFYLAFKEHELVGMAGVWDQHSIKQTRIADYSMPYQIARPFVNLLASLGIGFPLPRKGSVLRYLNVHSVLVHNNNPEIFSGILQQINEDCHKLNYPYFLAGFDTKDKLNKSFANFRNKRTILGKHFLVSTVGTEPQYNKTYYLETARI